MAIPVVVTLIATGCATVLLPRVRESRLQDRFQDNNGAIFGSTVGRIATGSFDKLIGFPGFVSQVYLDGVDESLEGQLQALPRFRHLAVLQAVSVESAVELREGFRLLQLRVASFSFCSGSFVNEMIQSSPNLQEVAIFECPTVNDDSLGPLGSCRSLRRLEINGSSATGGFARSLRALPRLREIEIWDSPISGAGLRAISGLHQLSRLRIMKGSGDVEIGLLVNMRSLQELHLDGFEHQLETVEMLARELPNTRVTLDGSHIAPM